MATQQRTASCGIDNNVHACFPVEKQVQYICSILVPLNPRQDELCGLGSSALGYNECTRTQ